MIKLLVVIIAVMKTKKADLTRSRKAPLVTINLRLLCSLTLVLLGSSQATAACRPTQPIEDCLDNTSSEAAPAMITGKLAEELATIEEQFERDGDMLISRLPAVHPDNPAPDVPELKSIDTDSYKPLSEQAENQGSLWPKALIPLWTTVDARVSSSDRTALAKVCYAWGLVGDVDCYPYENTELRAAHAVERWGDYAGPPYALLTKNDNGCYATAAELSLRSKSYQINVSTGCWATPALYHESGHVFAHKYHTHQRPTVGDWAGRDSVLAVQWENIQSQWHSQFNYAWAPGNVGPYDCRDIMHYSRYAGAVKNPDGSPREVFSFNAEHVDCRDVAGFAQGPSVNELLSVGLVYGFREDLRIAAFPDSNGGVRLWVWGADPETQMQLTTQLDGFSAPVTNPAAPFADTDQTWSGELNAGRRWVRMPDTPDPGLWERRITRTDLDVVRPGVYTFELTNAQSEHATITLRLGYGAWDWLVDMTQFWPQQGLGRYAGLVKFQQKSVSIE